MDLKKNINSFRYAFQGIADLFRTQQNSRFHAFAALVATAMGFFFQISRTEWLFVVLCIAIVISLEAMNTAIEYLTDLVSPEHHPLAGKAKDVAAGAVLIAAIGAAAIGAVIFGPKIMALC